MFECGLCHTQSEPREKAIRVITEKRLITHPAIPRAHKFKNASGHVYDRDDPGGEGTTIVKEVLAHKTCAEKVKK